MPKIIRFVRLSFKTKAGVNRPLEDVQAVRVGPVHVRGY